MTYFKYEKINNKILNVITHEPFGRFIESHGLSFFKENNILCGSFYGRWNGILLEDCKELYDLGWEIEVPEFYYDIPGLNKYATVIISNDHREVYKIADIIDDSFPLLFHDKIHNFLVMKNKIIENEYPETLEDEERLAPLHDYMATVEYPIYDKNFKIESKYINSKEFIYITNSHLTYTSFGMTVKSNNLYNTFIAKNKYTHFIGSNTIFYNGVHIELLDEMLKRGYDFDKIYINFNSYQCIASFHEVDSFDKKEFTHILNFMEKDKMYNFFNNLFEDEILAFIRFNKLKEDVSKNEETLEIVKEILSEWKTFTDKMHQKVNIAEHNATISNIDPEIVKILSLLNSIINTNYSFINNSKLFNGINVSHIDDTKK